MINCCPLEPWRVSISWINLLASKLHGTFLAEFVFSSVFSSQCWAWAFFLWLYYLALAPLALFSSFFCLFHHFNHSRQQWIPPRWVKGITGARREAIRSNPVAAGHLEVRYYNLMGEGKLCSNFWIHSTWHNNKKQWTINTLLSSTRNLHIIWQQAMLMLG